MKLQIVHEPTAYAVYEIAEDGGRERIVSFDTEREARDYCESRQKVRIVAEYDLG